MKLWNSSLLMIAAFVSISGAASAASKGDRMTSGQVLTGANDDFISSMDGRFRFVMQHDCNIVQYDRTTPLWASNTDGAGSNCLLFMQTDGNLVMYANTFRDASGVLRGWATWATNTEGNPGTFLVAQGDGNAVLYRNRTPLWATNTVVAPTIPARSGASNPHPGCSFSRTDTRCYGVAEFCNAIWACGVSFNGVVDEQSDGWTLCGACFGFSF